ncbi:MAG: PLP-dependent aminotransferase family protein [Nocardioidaceae bacterium]|nr:PLP-dependent aminotransferase family protein [Nocardioidaceae bacterium]
MWTGSELDPRDGARTDQVAALVVRQVERGELSVGSALPSERDLAHRLGVSRATVVRALDRLRAGGVVVTRHGARSVIAPSDRLLDPVAPVAARGPGVLRLDLRHGTTAAPHEVETAAGRVTGRHLRSAMAGDGPPPGGSPGLRSALAEHLTEQGVPTLPSQLTLTNGADAGLDLALQALDLGPGAALTESPTYPAALGCLRRHRLEVTGWPAGPTAWDTDQLAHLVRRTRPGVIYVQADNHNPTGHSVPDSSRSAMIELLRRHQVSVISDETLRPLWLGDVGQPPALSRHRGVISLGSLSKTVWGGLRVGWIRATQDISRRLQQHPAAALLAPSAFDELLAIEILDDLAAIVRRRRRLLRLSLDALQTSLDGLRDEIAWHPPTGGMTAWLDLRHTEAAVVTTAARRLGLLVIPGAMFTADGLDRRHLRLPFTATPAQLASAVDLLSQAMWSTRVDRG